MATREAIVIKILLTVARWIAVDEQKAAEIKALTNEISFARFWQKGGE